MDSRSSDHQSQSPKRLKTLASSVHFSGGNTLLHRLVLENSHPDESGSEIYVRAVLISMFDVPGSAVNALNDEGFTALHLAVLKNNLLLVTKLLSYLANIDVSTKCGRGDGNTALHLAVESGHLSIIQELLDKGAGIDIRNDRNYETALALAMKLRALDTVKILVGANVNQLIFYGTPLHVASQRYGSLEIAEFLIDAGADIDARAGNLMTPLHDAAYYGNLDIVKLLVGKGADLHAADNTGMTPLHFAAMERKLECVAFLLDQGAHVNAANLYQGWTPLHFAARHGLEDVVRVLLDRGADANARGIHGHTPLDFARARQNQACIDALQNVG